MVELFINSKSLGKQPVPHYGFAKFTNIPPYSPGVVTAVAMDAKGIPMTHFFQIKKLSNWICLDRWLFWDKPIFIGSPRSGARRFRRWPESSVGRRATSIS